MPVITPIIPLLLLYLLSTLTLSPTVSLLLVSFFTYTLCITGFVSDDTVVVAVSVGTFRLSLVIRFPLVSTEPGFLDDVCDVSCTKR